MRVWRKALRIAKPCAPLHIGRMTPPPARLGFFKLNVPDLKEATAFWSDAFGFAVTARIEEPDFLEHILTLGAQEAGPNLMLVQYRDGREVSIGSGHGPVGLICETIETSHEHALACGAEKITGVFEAGGVKIAVLKSPQGHEIELIQLPL